ncbi:MAG: glycosyltransferase [Acidobacteriota bacterium]
MLRPTMGHGGADRVTRTLLQHLDRKRFRPTLVLMKAEGPFLDDLPDDVPVHSLGVQRLVNAVGPLVRLLRRPPEILFSTSSGTNLVAALAHALRRRPCRLLLSERSTLRRDDRPGWKNRSLVALKRRLYRRADRLAAVSGGVAEDLVHLLGVEGGRVDVVYNPVITPEIAAQAAVPLDGPEAEDRRPLILSAGRLVPTKDQLTLIRAFARLSEGTDARLVILGEGPERGDLEREIDRLDLSGRVALPGFDSNPFRWMARAQVFVLSSRFEGLPGVLIQAMACGAAAVSTDCPTGPSEVITDGESGFLVTVGDVDALADRMGRLLADPDLRSRLAAQGREDVRQFSLESALRRYSQTIEKAAGR